MPATRRPPCWSARRRSLCPRTRRRGCRRRFWPRRSRQSQWCSRGGNRTSAAPRRRRPACAPWPSSSAAGRRKSPRPAPRWPRWPETGPNSCGSPAASASPCRSPLDLLDGRRMFIEPDAGDLPAFHADDPVSHGGQRRVVRDDDDGHAARAALRLQQG